MVRDEGPYLKPWIDFHLEQGFDKLIIFDNASDEPVRTTLANSYSTRDVEVVRVPQAWRENKEWGPGLICQKYMLAHPNPTKLCWMHAGVDEFMFCPRGYRVRDILKNTIDFDMLKVPWRIFHDRDCMMRPDITRPIYLDCVKSFEDPNLHCKPIVNLENRDAVFSGDTHYVNFDKLNPAIYEWASFADEEHHSPASGHLHKLGSSDESELVIAHYITMSKKEYSDKIAKGHSKFPGWTTARDDEWDFWSAYESRTDTRVRDAFLR